MGAIKFEETFLGRMIVERTELNDRIRKLERFISKNPETKEPLSLLEKQLKAMTEYRDILDERLKIHGIEAE
jgi:hypothetical protein